MPPQPPSHPPLPQHKPPPSPAPIIITLIIASLAADAIVIYSIIRLLTPAS